MFVSRKKLNLYSLAAAALVLSSCGGDSDSDAQNLVPTKSAIALTDAVAPEGCLSIPQYVGQIQALNPQLPLTTSSRRIDFSSKKGLRRNYELLASFGAFDYSRGTASKLQQNLNVTQQGCDNFTVTDINGTAAVYKIKEKSREKLTGQSENGEMLTYKWISPTQLEITTRYISYDLPCGSELNPIYVDQTKVYDWGQVNTEIIATDSPMAVDRNLLERISEATGKNVQEFYSGENQLESQLLGIANLKPRAELLACTSGPAEPPPPDDSNGGGNDGGGTTTPPPPPSGGSGGVIIPPGLGGGGALPVR